MKLPSGKEIKIASVICNDSNFVSFVRGGIERDTQVFLVPTWDWEPIDDYHNKWVIYRSIENGFSMVRSTYDGYTTATDQYGRVIMTCDTDSVGYEHVSFADVPVKRLFTIYKAAGMIIDWMYPVLLVLLLGIGIVRKNDRG